MLAHTAYSANDHFYLLKISPGIFHFITQIVREKEKNNEKCYFLEVIYHRCCLINTCINFHIIKKGSNYFCNQSRNNKLSMFLY